VCQKGLCERLLQSQSGEVLSEAEAIQRAQEGDSAAFERLYRLHSGRVFSLCVRMLKNPAEAEDLTQGTFLTVFRRIGTFRGESAFSTWLHCVAANLVLMHIRKKTAAQTSLEGMTVGREENDTRRLELSAPRPILERLGRSPHSPEGYRSTSPGIQGGGGALRHPRVRAPRDCQYVGVLDGNFKVATAQNPAAAPRTAPGRPKQ